VRRLLAVLSFSCVCALAADQRCPSESLTYSGHFSVRSVRIESPLDFVAATKLLWSGVTLPLQAGAVFDETAYSAGVEPLHQAVSETLGGSARVKVVVVRPGLFNCSDNKLDVVYYVFFFRYPLLGPSGVLGPSVTKPSAHVPVGYSLLPTATYDASTHLMPGLQGSVTTHWKLLDRTDFEGAASANSSLGRLVLAGHDAHFDYQLSYLYSELASNAGTLKKSTISGNVEGSKRTKNFLLRYTAAGDASTLGYGDLKTGIEASGSSFTAAYGIQAGNFVKHVAEGSWNHAFEWPWLAKKNNLHYPVVLDARGSGGLLMRAGNAPIAERFFGGNNVAGFLPGSVWDLREGPFIRSIAQNRFADSSGGDRYAAFNLTIAPTVYAKPLVPASLVSDKMFVAAKDQAVANAIVFEKLFLMGKQPAAIEAAKKLDAIATELDRISAELKTLPESDAVSAAETYVGVATRGVASAKKDPTRLPAVPVFVSLAEGRIRALGGSMTSHADHLAGFLTDLQAAMSKIDSKAAEAKAESDLAAVKPILNTFLYRLNGIAVSPVVMLDAARMTPDVNGTRFGIGGGIRLSLLNLNFTAGYSVNPHPVAALRQGRGAVFVSFDIANLFR
jgi:hypothetical protein